MKTNQTIQTVKTIKTYETPEVIIKMSKFLLKEKKITFLLETKKKGDRKFISEVIEAEMTKELFDWFTLLKDDKIKVKADNEQGFIWQRTGNMSTVFQRFLLSKLNKKYKPGILSELVFQCDNRDNNFVNNPFRLIRFREDKRNILTLVYAPSKKRVQYMDTNTGNISNRYYQKYATFADGTKTKSFINPTQYRRLVIETVSEVPVYEEDHTLFADQ